MSTLNQLCHKLQTQLQPPLSCIHRQTCGGSISIESTNVQILSHWQPIKMKWLALAQPEACACNQLNMTNVTGPNSTWNLCSTAYQTNMKQSGSTQLPAAQHENLWHHTFLNNLPCWLRRCAPSMKKACPITHAEAALSQTETCVCLQLSMNISLAQNRTWKMCSTACNQSTWTNVAGSTQLPATQHETDLPSPLHSHWLPMLIKKNYTEHEKVSGPITHVETEHWDEATAIT